MTRWLVPAMFVLLLGLGLVAAVTGANDLLPWVLMALILPVSAWYLEDGRRAAGAWFPTVVLIAVIAAASAAPVVITVTGSTAGEATARNEFYCGEKSSETLKKFSSYEELENFVKENVGDYYNGDSYWAYSGWAGDVSSIRRFASSGIRGDFSFYIGDSGSPQANGQASVDYSTTNVQIAEVDEADIVKSDGEYLYVVSENRVIIIDAYPAEEAYILSEIEENTNPVEIFINGDKLVVLGLAFAKVYDVSDRGNPVLVRDVSFNGCYFNSRIIGDYVYVIISSPVIRYTYNWENTENYYVEVQSEIALPEITDNDNVMTIQATEIYYFDVSSYSYKYTTIMAVNIQADDEELTTETILMCTDQNIFVSSNNIYITYTTCSARHDYSAEKTVVHKISIADGEIEYKCFGEVPGHVLNRFSMDEYQGYFRIATTTGRIRGTGDNASKNHIYVLNGNLNIVGRLENIAPGERIYSARFMGSRAYLVTFKKIDPLFVIDLSDPQNPEVLGELEIPGYSDYLYPYDETHLIGVGKDTIESDSGNFAWYQGVKIALFDVSDPENPQEISKYVIGERGTDSYALRDHRALLFSRSKNLLVIPISLVENSSSQCWSSTTWRGAYVFDITLDDGFVFKGGITHYDNENRTQNNSCISSWFSSSSSAWSSYSSPTDYSVKRSLYIDDVLYTVSEGLVKMNNLDDLSEINEVELQ